MARISKDAAHQHRTWKDQLELLGLRAMLGLGRALPYAHEVWLAGRLGRVAGRLTKHRKRIETHLSEVFPDFSDKQRSDITNGALDNLGRALIEHFLPEMFDKRLLEMPVSGAGWAAVTEASRARRPIILVGAHYGNYNAVRARMAWEGHKIGALYRPMNNAAFHDFYMKGMEQLGQPLFERSRRGMAEMMRFLREGNMLAILVDQHLSDGVLLDFLGRPARTTLTHAELALKYNALMVPAFGRRLEDGIRFELILHAPIEHSTAEQMAQEVNNHISDMIRAYPEQWLWSHRRWKG